MTCHHHWTHQPGEIDSEAFACTECGEVSPACVVTHTGEDGEQVAHASGTALLICERCQRSIQRGLDDIEATWDHWDARDGYRQSSMQFQAIVAGATRKGGSGANMRKPEDVEGRLWWWVALWSEHVGAENLGASDFLKSKLIWAAHNIEASRFHEFRAEVASLLWSARHIVGIAPTRRTERCMYCGGRVVQDWADYRWRPREDGLSDRLRCTRKSCGAQWIDTMDFQRNVKQHVHEIPEGHPDELVTLEQAEVIFPDVPRATWRSWVSKDRRAHETSIEISDAWDDAWTAWYEAGNVGPHPSPPEIFERELPERGRTERGKWLYRLGDLDAKVWARVSEARPGRPASGRMAG